MSSDQQQLRTIRLLGDMGRRFGRVHNLAVASPGEAVRALCVLRPGFRAYMDSRERRFRLLVRGAPLAGADEDLPAEINMRRPLDAEIVIAPVIRGAKSAWARIIIGAVLIAAAFYTGGASLGASGVTFSGFAGQMAFGVGLSLVVGGLAQMLAPTPSFDGPSDRKAGFLFGGPVQTDQQGYPVPVGYGELVVGGARISTGIWSEDIPA